jgi:hypothetical protein
MTSMLSAQQCAVQHVMIPLVMYPFRHVMGTAWQTVWC